MVEKTSSTLVVRSQSYAWPVLAVTLLAIQAGFLFFVKPGASLSVYSNAVDILYFLLLLLATGIVTLNAVRSGQSVRLFWSFLALSCSLWALNAWGWVYYVAIMGKEYPDFLLSAGSVYLHLVFLIAAVASRPHLKLSRVKPYQTTLNLLLLLFFSHSDVPHTVPAEISLCVYRVLQEALQNAVKHSGDQHIKVDLRGAPDEIQLTVCDSGTGFDHRDAVNRQGLGAH